MYTKGKWRIEKYSGSKWGLAITTEEHQIAGIVPGKSASGLLEKMEHEANAKLIAAAPLQNQTLKDVYADAELLADGRYAISQKRLNDIGFAIAIAKAEGH